MCQPCEARHSACPRGQIAVDYAIRTTIDRPVEFIHRSDRWWTCVPLYQGVPSPRDEWISWRVVRFVKAENLIRRAAYPGSPGHHPHTPRKARKARQEIRIIPWPMLMATLSSLVDQDGAPWRQTLLH